MSFSPALRGPMPPIFLSSMSSMSGGRIARGVNEQSPASAAWSTTNRIVYVPFVLNRAVTVYQLFWLNGATVGTDNLQAGVYDGSFNRLIAGTSTLSAGASACQFDNITDTVLGPGRYYMALWANGTTATVWRSNNYATNGYIYYETNASGLPTTGTPANPSTANPARPVFGLALRSTP